ncbi:MAG: aminotransferase class V-fold PLP-dependent enzyme, partial [Mycoplasmatales bacterium]
MLTYPIKTLSVQAAIKLQFKLIDEITKEFSGAEILNLGDLGIVQPTNSPQMTHKIERVIANFFQTEAAVLVRGAGTNALRLSLFAVCQANRQLIVHDAPIYPTTKVSLEMMQIETIAVDFNELSELEAVFSQSSCNNVLIQYTRQQPMDSYNYEQVVELAKKYQKIIVTDDNYAAMKVPRLGASMSEGLSTFSSFKLQGPTGVGIIIGSKKLIEKVRATNYSGGSKVQGFEAQAVLRGLVSAPVSLAIQSQVVDAVVDQLVNGTYELIKTAYVANAQSKVIIVELTEPIAKDLIRECEKLGAAPNPVGAESI